MSRSTRAAETRETEKRNITWKPSSQLPELENRDGWRFRWVRAQTLGESDIVNVNNAYRDGWRPASVEDLPEYADLQGKDSRGQDLIVFGGLIACKMPEEMAAARDAYYRDLSEAQMASVSERLKQEARENKRMPLFNESKQE